MLQLVCLYAASCSWKYRGILGFIYLMGNMSWISLTRYLFKCFDACFCSFLVIVGMVDCHVVLFWQAWSPFNFGSDFDSGEKEISVRSSCKDGCLLL